MLLHTWIPKLRIPSSLQIPALNSLLADAWKTNSQEKSYKPVGKVPQKNARDVTHTHEKTSEGEHRSKNIMQNARRRRVGKRATVRCVRISDDVNVNRLHSETARVNCKWQLRLAHAYNHIKSSLHIKLNDMYIIRVCAHLNGFPYAQAYYFITAHTQTTHKPASNASYHFGPVFCNHT